LLHVSAMRGVVLVGVGCIVLTMLAFLLPGVTETEGGDSGLKASVGAAVIGLTTLLVIEHHRAADALRANEELWRTMVETAAVGITTLDLDLHHLTANTAFQRMTGDTEAELRSLTVRDITH
jgi:PAS domain-containing protein